MKIYDRNLTGASASEAGRAQESQNLSRTGASKSPTSGGVDGSGVSGSNDRVEFSGTLSRLSRALTTFESTRASRVQALAAQYQSGNYKPDSAATSRGLVADAMSAGLPPDYSKMPTAALVEQLMSARQQLDFACGLARQALA